MVEMQLGNVAKAEAHGKFVPQVGARMLEGGEGFALLAFGSADADAHARMTAIRGDVHLDDLDREQPRVIGLETDDLREFLAYGFGDA